MKQPTQIRGILIDPETRAVGEVLIARDADGCSLDAMYAALGCDTVDVVRGALRGLPSRPEDDVWIDDNGLFRPEEAGCFQLPDWLSAVVGPGLILGYDADGNCTDHTLTAADLELLRGSVRFLSRKEAGL